MIGSRILYFQVYQDRQRDRSTGCL